MQMLRYHNLGTSLVDGPGRRAVVWFQGCPVHCAGCQNRALWDYDGGQVGSAFWLAMRLATHALPVTITGGEPFFQAGALAELLRCLRRIRPGVEVLVYTGYTWEDLLTLAESQPAILEALGYIDVLVDGPYVRRLDHDALQYRGSMNQRVIDVAATLAGSEVVVLDWDRPTLTLTPEGDVLGAAALLAPFLTLGDLRDTARCGQATR